jgi:hypothetical protein
MHLMKLQSLLSAALFCAACRSPATTIQGGSSQNVQVADSLQLDYGKHVLVSGTTLAVTFDSLVQDSRCPTDVQCVWAGDLVVNVVVEQTAAASPMGMADTIRLSTATGRSQVTYGHRFDLIAERPPHRSTETIPPEQYWIALRITALGD